LDIRYTSIGFVPHVGLHRRGGLYYQESSYSHLWFLGAMLFAAVAVALLPWQTVALGGLKLKYWISAGCIWTGICGVAPYFLRNALGQTILIDPQNETLCIRKRGVQQTIRWREVIALQICYQCGTKDSKFAGYQLNLVWKDTNGTVKRHCLLKHVIKRNVVALGNAYVYSFRFNMIDEMEIRG